MTQFPSPIIKPYGDHAFLIDWKSEVFSDVINDKVHRLAERLRQSGKYQEVIPGYDSVLCVFNLSTVSASVIRQHIQDMVALKDEGHSLSGKSIEIPVHYGGDYGPDMERICESAKLSIDEVISLHSAQTYRVCMMGFIPGFAFLSPAPDALHHPRLKTPRVKVPAGSIGIANWQTGIYGLESPGGWQIIGRTPLSIFDAQREIPFLLNAGDSVRFIPQ